MNMKTIEERRKVFFKEQAERLVSVRTSTVLKIRVPYPIQAALIIGVMERFSYEDCATFFKIKKTRFRSIALGKTQMSLVEAYKLSASGTDFLSDKIVFLLLKEAEKADAI
jgi:hypothetical protein